MGFQAGLKLRTTDISLTRFAKDLFEKNEYHYIELYVVPETFKSTASIWSSLSIPFIIHAPHMAHNANLAIKGMRASNQNIYSEVKQFADLLDSPIIIFHSGCNGTVEEAIFQVKTINDVRMHVENKPLVGINGETCHGTTPSEILLIKHECNLQGWVLDFGHAINLSNSIEKDPMELIREFLILEPTMYHISDGDISSKRDMHLNFGAGNFPIANLVNMIFNNRRLTLETPRFEKNTLDEFIRDLSFLTTPVRRVSLNEN